MLNILRPNKIIPFKEQEYKDMEVMDTIDTMDFIENFYKPQQPYTHINQVDINENHINDYEEYDIPFNINNVNYNEIDNIRHNKYIFNLVMVLLNDYYNNLERNMKPTIIKPKPIIKHNNFCIE